MSPLPLASRATRAAGAVAAGAAALGLGCAMSTSSPVRFVPASADRAGAGFVAELMRSCELDDCRTQAARLTLPTGEVMKGKLKMLSGGPLAPEAVTAVQDRRPALLSLEGDRGSRMQCELLFSTGTRHAAGTCRDGAGQRFSVSF